MQMNNRIILIFAKFSDPNALISFVAMLLLKTAAFFLIHDCCCAKSKIIKASIKGKHLWKILLIEAKKVLHNVLLIMKHHNLHFLSNVNVMQMWCLLITMRENSLHLGFIWLSWRSFVCFFSLSDISNNSFSPWRTMRV